MKLLNPHPLVVSWEAFQEEARELTEPADGKVGRFNYTEPWIKNIALPLLLAHEMYRAGQLEDAHNILDGASKSKPWPWLVGGRDWLQRRLTKRAGGQR